MDNYVDQQKSARQDPTALLTRLEKLVDLTQGQQKNTDQQIQESFSKTSTKLLDSKRLTKLHNEAKKLHQAAMMGISHLTMNIAQYEQTLDQMERDCHEQQVASDLQVIQALQQAISSMAEAQRSLLQSQAINQVFDEIHKCGNDLKQITQEQNSPPATN